jgi:hypothetical protein
MNNAKLWGLLAAICLLGFPPLVFSENELTLGDFGVVEVGGEVSLPLTLTNTADEVQGLVAAFDWDAGKGTGAALTPAAALASADTVVARVEPSYMVLGVVMDNDGAGNEIIPVGSGQLLATAKITAGPGLGTVPVVFQDGLYASVAGGPVLDNVIVVGGLSIGEVEGLVLDDGSFEVVDCINRFYIAAGADSSTGKARVLMRNCAAVEGYVVSLAHDNTKVTLTGIVMGAAATAQAADFEAAEVFPTGGTLGVVIDLEAPYTNNTIPTGTANEIAVLSYNCLTQPPAGSPPIVSALTFVDGVFGTPAKENVIVVAGLSIGEAEGLKLEDGAFTCLPLGAEETNCSDGIDNDGDGKTDCADSDCAGTPACPSAEICGNGLDDDNNGLTDCCDAACKGTAFCRENCFNGVDDDCNGLVDGDDPMCQRAFACGGAEIDPDTGLPESVSESIGWETSICFYMLNPEDEIIGAHDMDHVQGFSMAVEYCCDIAATPELDISGTILEALGAEYVKVDVDNDPADGDGCQLIIGVLVDALPPFDGRTIAASPDYQKMGCVKFTVSPNALCGRCDIEFKDGVNGSGKVPINNLVSIENFSYPVAFLADCWIDIVEQARFFRGDCNFSGDSGGPDRGAVAVDISDAAAMVSYLFLPGMYKFEPPCLDACDCNDDGRIDLADVVCVLRYLFQKGKFPPAPGPGWRETGLPNPDNVEATGAGIDPTLDMLDCEAGTACI